MLHRPGYHSIVKLRYLNLQMKAASRMVVYICVGSGDWRQPTADVHNRLCRSTSSGCFLCWSIAGIVLALFIFSFQNLMTAMHICLWLDRELMLRAQNMHITSAFVGISKFEVIMMHRCLQSLLSFRKFSAWINPMR